MFLGDYAELDRDLSHLFFRASLLLFLCLSIVCTDSRDAESSSSVLHAGSKGDKCLSTVQNNCRGCSTTTVATTVYLTCIERLSNVDIVNTDLFLLTK